MEQPQGSPETQSANAAAAAATAEANRLGRAKEFVSEKYGAASEAVRDKYNDVRDKVGEKYTQVKDKVDEIDFTGLMDQGRAYVRSNPGKALLVSIGVGFVIGLLLRRDDD